MKNIHLIVVPLLMFSSCNQKEPATPEKAEVPAVVIRGLTISFSDEKTAAFFRTEKAGNDNIHADYKTIGKIGATISPSNTGASQNIVLFENPDLAGNYAQLMQHQINISQIENINIRQKKIELERTIDLQKHGAATGRDLLEAQMAVSMEETNLANERAALTEHEARLKAGGFDPVLLRRARAGTAYIICDMPENQIAKIKRGSTCNIVFTSFPDEAYTGRVENIADMMDNITRMVKVRISVDNSSSRLKAGMFADVSFGLSEGNFITVSKNSLVTVQGKHHVFVGKNPGEFERREVQTGQQIGDRIIIFSGLSNGEEVVTEGVMQLKGLSFGY